MMPTLRLKAKIIVTGGEKFSLDFKNFFKLIWSTFVCTQYTVCTCTLRQLLMVYYIIHKSNLKSQIM